jgi:predicted Zn-dependent protease
MIRLSARSILLIFPLLFAAMAGAQEPASHVEEATTRATAASSPVVPASRNMLFGMMPVSTHSTEARKLVERAIDEYENVLLDQAVSTAHQATKKDPHFALAFAVWSFAARRNQPSEEALHHAEALAVDATPQEQLLVHWMTSVQKDDMLPAITATNDLLKKYPDDKHVLYLTSEWLYFQQDYERSRKIMEHVLQLDPNFPPILNMLGYAYMESGDPNPAKAVSFLQRYAQLQPQQPNPEDSLGEVYRYAGEDENSLAHYTAALKIIPNFITSQTGLGDTYTLMGNHARARAEYDKAMEMATNSRDRLHAAFQKALAYFWEGQSATGRHSLDALLEEARQKKDAYAQFEIGFGRAMLALDAAAELEQLRSIEASLQKPIPGMSESDRNLFLAQTLREEVRIAVLSRIDGVAEPSLSKVAALANRSRDLTIADCYDSARGFLLLSQGDTNEAADELATDQRSPVVLTQLAATQEKLGDAAAAAATRNRIKYMRADTIEWYLITHPNGVATK